MAQYPWLYSIDKAIKALCRVLNLAWPTLYRIPFTAAELAALTALKAACEAYMLLRPTPGEDNDPTTPE